MCRKDKMSWKKEVRRKKKVKCPEKKKCDCKEKKVKCPEKKKCDCKDKKSEMSWKKKKCDCKEKKQKCPEKKKCDCKEKKPKCHQKKRCDCKQKTFFNPCGCSSGGCDEKRRQFSSVPSFPFQPLQPVTQPINVGCRSCSGKRNVQTISIWMNQ